MFRRDRPAGRRPAIPGAGLLLVGLFLLLVLAGPAVAPNDPLAVDPERRLAAPGLEYPLGTDQLGRCVLSRLLHGARWSLGVAGVALGLIVAIGVSVGALAGYYRGPLDAVLMRVVDVLLAFPALVPALAIVGMLGPGTGNALAGLVGVWWAGYARVVRGLVLSAREQPYVDAARALGARDLAIVRRQILPNVLPYVLVLASVEMGSLILAMAGLSFLGLGAQPPSPEWGAMISDGRGYLLTAPQLMVYPGAAISLAVIGFNLVGERLRDRLDPRAVLER